MEPLTIEQIEIHKSRMLTNLNWAKHQVPSKRFLGMIKRLETGILWCDEAISRIKHHDEKFYHMFEGEKA